MSWRWILGLLAVGAVVGFTIFGVMLVDAVDVTSVDPAQAEAEIRAVLDELDTLDRAPADDAEAGGDAADDAEADRDAAGGDAAAEPERLHVLTYNHDLGRLARADVPLWFLELKEPALEFALRGLDVDLKDRGLTVEQLRAHGRGLVLLEAPQNGDRLLVWLD